MINAVEWVTLCGIAILAKPALPGVWRRKGGGFLVRGKAKDPQTGRLKEVFKVLPDERDPKAAFVWLTNERAKIREGAVASPATSTPRFSEFAALLMEEKVRNLDLASEATRELWADVLEHHLLRAPFASAHVDEIRAREVCEWKATIPIGEGPDAYSPHTANVWLRILKVIVNTYVARYELERNPMLAVELFDTSRWRGRITKEQPNSLTPEELPTFLAKMRTLFPHFFALVLLGFTIGARPSSLRPLRRGGPVRDFDPDTRELVIRRSHTRGQIVMESSKNATDVTLVLPRELVEVIEWHIATFLVSDDPAKRKPRITRAKMAASNLLFPSSKTGELMNTTALRKPFEAVSRMMMEETKGSSTPFTKVITPKGMRRTNKDLMRSAGVPDVVSMAIANHLDEEMHNHYSTVSQTEMHDALARVIRLADYRQALVIAG